MPTATPKIKRKTSRKKTASIKAKIEEQILALLGKPDDLWRIDVHLYQAGRARVNIWQRRITQIKTGGSLAKTELTEITQITDSHYLALSPTAIIVTANPPITRRY